MSKTSELAEKIVNDIMENLTDRRGIRQAFDGIDEEIREEIVETLRDIVIFNLEASP